MKTLLQTVTFFQYADPTDEPTSQMYDQTFEDYDLSIQEWKGKYFGKPLQFV